MWSSVHSFLQTIVICLTRPLAPDIQTHKYTLNFSRHQLIVSHYPNSFWLASSSHSFWNHSFETCFPKVLQRRQVFTDKRSWLKSDYIMRDPTNTFDISNICRSDWSALLVRPLALIKTVNWQQLTTLA